MAETFGLFILGIILLFFFFFCFVGIMLIILAVGGAIVGVGQAIIALLSKV